MAFRYRVLFSSLALALSLLAGPAQAVDFGLGLNVGSQGAGVSGTLGINEQFAVRLGHNRFSTSGDLEEDGVLYEVDVELAMTDLLIDWHPWAGPFRVSLGYVSNNSDLSGTATITQPVDFGGVVITDGRATTELIFDESAYYLGVGWGNPTASEKGFTFAADLGVVALGEPDFEITSVTANSTVGNVPVSQANIDQEEQNVQDELGDYLYPVLRVGFVYAF